MNELTGVLTGVITPDTFKHNICYNRMFHLAFVRSFPDEVAHNGGEEEQQHHYDDASDHPSRKLCRRD